MIDWETFILTLKLATVTTVILFVISIPLVYWLYHTSSKLKSVVRAIITLPLVLPPTVLGFYMLVVFSPESTLGHFLLENLGLQFVFSFEGLVLASVIYSLPFMVQPMYSGLKNIDRNLALASYTLGKSSWQTMLYVLLPNIKPSILTGIVLSFAHTIGEFGVVLMIGGNLRGETKVVSISIFEAVEKMDYNLAHGYSVILLLFAFVVVWGVYVLNEKKDYE